MQTEQSNAPTSLPDPPRRAIVMEESRRRHGPGFWAGLGILAAALAGLCWYAYPYALRQKSLADDFPAVQKSVTAFGDRIGKTESDLRQWYGDQQALRERVAKLESGAGDKLRALRNQSREFAENVYRRAMEEMDRRAERVDQRLAQVEASQESGQAKLARLETDLSGIRQQIAAQTSQLAAVEQNAVREREALEQRVTATDEKLESSQGEISRLSRSVDRNKVAFELTTNRSEELAPGISICVTGTDVAHRRVKGWLWIMPDRKTIWLRDQPAQQPLAFYSESDGKRREVVFTRVNKDSALGYLLLPVDEAPEAKSGD
jgi:hypothetical protein